MLVDIIRPVVDELATLGELNFILSDGECLYVHSHTNLHVLQRTASTQKDVFKTILLATAPLTAEPWQALAPRALHVYRQGEEVLHVCRATRPAKWRPAAQLHPVVARLLEISGIGRGRWIDTLASMRSA
jgi:hypothetical protein